MVLPRFFFVAAVVVIWQPGWTQSPTYGLGRTPTPEEIRAWDISISPIGKELPLGQGTAREGALRFRLPTFANCRTRSSLAIPPPVRPHRAGRQGHRQPKISFTNGALLHRSACVTIPACD